MNTERPQIYQDGYWAGRTSVIDTLANRVLEKMEYGRTHPTPYAALIEVIRDLSEESSCENCQVELTEGDPDRLTDGELLLCRECLDKSE